MVDTQLLRGKRVKTNRAITARMLGGKSFSDRVMIDSGSHGIIKDITGDADGNPVCDIAFDNDQWCVPGDWITIISPSEEPPPTPTEAIRTVLDQYSQFTSIADIPFELIADWMTLLVNSTKEQS